MQAISCSMNRKWLLGIILVLTVIATIIIAVFSINTRYEKLVVDKETWNDLISHKTESTSINLEKIIFNDYHLLIDEESSIIYYSVVESSRKYNPSVEYKTTSKNGKIAFNEYISMEKFNETNTTKVVVYDDNSYHIYSLVVTDFPILNINYKEEMNISNKVEIELELFDNHVDSPQRTIKSEGELNMIEEGKEYRFSLRKESIGRNERENHISIFGMPKQDEYTLKQVSDYTHGGKYVQLFLNNKSVGVFAIAQPEGGPRDNFDRNRDNNR